MLNHKLPRLVYIPLIMLALVACAQATPTRSVQVLPTQADTPTPLPTDTPLPPTAMVMPGWQLYQSEAEIFELQFPPEGQVSEDTDEYTRIDLPILPGTNLVEKYLQINVSDALPEECRSPLTGSMPSEAIAAETVQIGDIEFIQEAASEGAMGSFYDYVGYSTSNGTNCVSLGFVLHSTNPDNYDTPPQEFNQAAETQVFEQILATFRWLEP